MKKIIVLGAGLVGNAIAIDLAKDFQVTAVDIDISRLDKLAAFDTIRTIRADLSDESAVKGLVANNDLAIGAVPGFMGFQTLKAVVEAGKNIVDISFFEQDPFVLDELAKSQDVTAVIDCGVAPGMSNIILGYHSSKMDVNSFACYVGGLPFKRILPFQYKAPFSPVDVLEEYTRPARLVENGKIVVKPAMSETEMLDFEQVGTLEAFNTDGLRTLLQTMAIPDMKEKTLRYPSHIGYMRFLRDAGFFNKTSVDVNGVTIRPADFTARILVPHWKLEKGEKEFTIMKIIISGNENGQNIKYVYDLYDEFDIRTGTSSMARTTGYTCTAVARLILQGKVQNKGLVPPELLGKDENIFQNILQMLGERNVHYNVAGSDKW